MSEGLRRTGRCRTSPWEGSRMEKAETRHSPWKTGCNGRPSVEYKTKEHVL